MVYPRMFATEAFQRSHRGRYAAETHHDLEALEAEPLSPTGDIVLDLLPGRGQDGKLVLRRVYENHLVFAGILGVLGVCICFRASVFGIVIYI